MTAQPIATSEDRLGHLPSFSIVVETENFETMDPEAFSHCLDLLAAQDVPPTRANEVLLMDSGDVPPAMLERLKAAHLTGTAS